MPKTYLARRLTLASLAAVSAVILVGVTTLGGSHAQTPPTPIPGQPNLAATATYVAILSMQQQQLQQQPQQQQQLLQQQLLQQQVAGTPTAQPGVAATATYAAIIANLNQQIAGTPSPTPAVAPVSSSTPVTAPSGATAAADACALQLQPASGGQTLEFEQVQMTLPAGNYTYGFIRGDSGGRPALVVCSTQTSSTIYIDANTAQETARRANSDAGTTALNQLRAAAHARGGSAGGGGASSPSGIQPPNTGDGGLR